ncbi:MAG: T9SS type A sorting domain-containing protein, partial [Bacteroidota bacterium]|nr:T9SS type A sorting domain-containing protein [Bacteroidota bacterium]
QVVVSTVIGQQYMIRIQRLTTNSAMAGRICIYNPPANNECAISIELNVDSACLAQTFTNEGASYSTQTPLPTCGGTLNSSTMLDIWFHFYAPPNGLVQIETSAGSMTDGVMQLYSGSCNSLVLVECDDNDGPGNMPRIERICNPLTPNALYRIRIFGKAGSFGTFDLCIWGPENFTAPQQDCSGVVNICNSQTFVNSSSSSGCTQDLSSSNRGCLISNERQGSWYYFSPGSTGTIEFTIIPINSVGDQTTVDFDFAIWNSGYQMVCPPVGAPVRCSYASAVNSGTNIGAGTYLTGLKIGEMDTSEPGFNGVNGFVAPLTISADQVGSLFLLYIDNFDTDGQRFKLEWTLTGGSSITCMILPVTMTDLHAEVAAGTVAVKWSTVSESATDHFVVERSLDGESFEPLGSVAAAGYSQQRVEYEFHDRDPYPGLSYYRLRQIDSDGSLEVSSAISVSIGRSGALISVMPNPAQDRITLELPSTIQGLIEIVIFDLSGTRVQNAFLDGSSVGPIQVPVEDLKPGSYFISVTSETGYKASGRFIKQ